MEPLQSLQTKLKEQLPQLELREGEPMARHTTFRVGGPAACMALPRGEEELRQILRLAHRRGCPPFFWGKALTCWWRMKGWIASSSSWPGGWTTCRGTEKPALLWAAGSP